MGCFIRSTVFFVLLWAVVVHCRARSHHHRIFAAPPQRFSRNFLESYAKKSVDELNKKLPSDDSKYVLVDVIGGHANEKTKALEIVAKFGRTRCQKTEDRYFCQTAPEFRLGEKLFKVDIFKKDPNSTVEFTFEEKPVETLPIVQKLMKSTIVSSD